MKTRLTFLLVLMVAALPFAGTRTMSANGSMMMAQGHMQMEQSGGTCPTGDGTQSCPMEGTDMTGCTMDGTDMTGCTDGMDGMMDGCGGDGGMMGLFAPSALGLQFHLFLASLGIL